MTRAGTIVAGVALATAAVFAHASGLHVDAGVLQTQVLAWEFDPPRTSTSPSDCRQGGWADWVDDDGEPFGSQNACVTYVSGGGVLFEKPQGSGQ